MPKVSVIVPNYNHASFLKERLDSILNQTFQDFEIILLDDASTDTSVEILKNYSTGKRVSHFIINKKNSGSPFKQWKKGLDLAKGDCIWIAESDDSCDLNFLETHLEYLKTYDVSAAKIMVLDNLIKTDTIMVHSVFKKQDEVKLSSNDFSYNCPLFNVSSMVFKKIDKNILLNNTFTNYNIIGDMVFYYEFFLGKKIRYNKKTINYYRQHDKGVSTTQTKDLNYYMQYFKENVNFINRVYLENDKFTNKSRKEYIRRRYNKIKNRTTFKVKRSFLFLQIYIKHQFQMFVNVKNNNL